MTNKANQKEIWKTYPDYDFIEVSNLGRVRTKDRTIIDKNGRKQFVKGRILRQQLKKSGYMQVAFSVNGKLVHLYVHRMVATCYIPNPNNYPEVNHIDNDRTNNAVSNLEWCTHEYNMAYREKCGVSAKETSKVLRKPVFAVNLETSRILRFESQSEAARQLNIYQSKISAVIKGKRNKTGGYWFCDADDTAVEKARAKFGDEIARKVEELIRQN